MHLTPEELEAALGERLKSLRLARNLDQNTLAGRTGISVRALRSLKAGQCGRRSGAGRNSRGRPGCRRT
jgi:hypothetical protein